MSGHVDIVTPPFQFLGCGLYGLVDTVQQPRVEIRYVRGRVVDRLDGVAGREAGATH
jgi:hypothetical protein